MSIQRKVDVFKSLNREITNMIAKRDELRDDLSRFIIESEFCPYKHDDIVFCKREKYIGQDCRIIKLKISYADGWHIKVVAMLLDEDGYDFQPTDWNDREDSLLSEFIIKINELLP